MMCGMKLAYVFIPLIKLRWYNPKSSTELYEMPNAHVCGRRPGSGVF